MSRFFFCGLYIGVTSLLLLAKIPLSESFGDDSSGRADCIEAAFPRVGMRVCYRITIKSNGDCDAAKLDEFDEVIDEKDRMIQIASPNFYTGGQYPDRTVCQYHVPACADREFLHLQWNRGEFELEHPCDIFGPRTCLDLVHIPGNTIDTEHLVIDDSDGSFCGMQPSSTTQVSSRPMRVTFSSNNAGTFRGFLLNFMCGDPDEALQGPKGMGGLPGPPPDRCRELGGFSPPPVPTQRIELGQNGSELQLPPGVFLTYNNSMLKVLQNEKVLRTFSNIRRLFFWTGLNGTLVFVGSANVPRGEIFGGGRLQIVDDCAYYATFLIPPRFNPNSQERDVISFILNALNPFFADQNIVDDGEDPTVSPPTTPPPPSTTYSTHIPTRPPPPMKGSAPGFRGTREVEEAVHNVWKRSLIHEPTPPPPELDPRVSVNALTLAVRFQNACNVFLRRVSRSYLNILDNEGLLETETPTERPTIGPPGKPTRPTVGPPGQPTRRPTVRPPGPKGEPPPTMIPVP